MKKLSEFETVEQAREYATCVEGKIITSNMMTQFMVMTELYGWFRERTDDMSLALMDRVQTTSEFNFTIGTSPGDANIQLMGALQLLYQDDVKAPNLEQLKNTLIGYANPQTKPYENVGELQFQIAKGDDVTYYHLAEERYRKTYNFELMTALPIPVTAEIQQRFANARNPEEMTEWATCAFINNVQLTQRDYMAIVPQRTSAHRELRVKLPADISFYEKAKLPKE